MTDYKTDRLFSDGVISQIKVIVGPYLLEPASLEEDCKEATDLIVLRGRDMRIACRVRRHGYADRYPDEFTIRSRRRSGARTELSKIIEGWGDWFFYGHLGCDGKIESWLLIDLHAFRAELIRNNNLLKFGEIYNGDGKTAFIPFSIHLFPDNLVIARSSRDCLSRIEQQDKQGNALLRGSIKVQDQSEMHKV